MNDAKLLVTGALFVVLAALGGCGDKLSVALPDYQRSEKAVWLDQNWSPEQRNWFHHADQGTLTFGIPYEWFIALEQPSLSFAAPGLLSDPSYLDRYGFIPDDTRYELPIGFAHGGAMPQDDGSPWPNPQTKMPMTGVGLTCAGCHTGRFTYQNKTVLIDGGPALTDLFKFRTGVALSLAYTRYVPFRFGRFADRVLGPDASAAAKSELREQLDAALARVKAVGDLEDKVKPQHVEEGYARLDALNRIGNTVFALDLGNPANYVGTSAPVHYPRIWNAPWYAWVQYNSSIEQPMVRNAGEALGVSAPLNLTHASRGVFASGVQAKTLFEMERLLAGQQPDASRGFNGLKSPQWPGAILPAIDRARAAKGADLYKNLCQGCHLPPVTDAAFWTSARWQRPNSAGERYLDLELIPLEHIGTDPAQAEDMKNRKVAIPASLEITTDEFGGALGQVVEKAVLRWYESQQPPISAASRRVMNGNRAGGIRAPLAYMPRPLNGIWATPPYLHNGSVPNLYALLSPVAERPARFYLGNREYDPEHVGYRTDKFSGGFEFDTAIRGNRNTGHEFADGSKKDGVIGRLLTPDERLELIEYLKTL